MMILQLNYLQNKKSFQKLSSQTKLNQSIKKSNQTVKKKKKKKSWKKKFNKKKKKFQLKNCWNVLTPFMKSSLEGKFQTKTTALLYTISLLFIHNFQIKKEFWYQVKKKKNNKK